MPRELIKAEKEFITRNHEKMTPAEMSEDMRGIGKKTIEKFIETSVMTKAEADETPEERHEKLAKKTGLTVGKLMGRDPDRGIAVMTPGASELSDAKRVLTVPSIDKAARNKPDRIFVMDPNKKVR